VLIKYGFNVWNMNTNPLTCLLCVCRTIAWNTDCFTQFFDGYKIDYNRYFVKSSDQRAASHSKMARRSYVLTNRLYEPPPPPPPPCYGRATPSPERWNTFYLVADQTDFRTIRVGRKTVQVAGNIDDLRFTAAGDRFPSFPGIEFVRNRGSRDYNSN